MIDKNDSLRVKVTGRCNLNCWFCHEEGGDRTSELTLTQTDEAITFARLYGFGKFHLTGGEPTCQNELKTIVAKITSAGFPCGITTNGQFDGKILGELKSASVTSLNFSLHSINPDSWCQVQQHSNVQLAQRQIDRVQQNIREALRLGIRTKVNIVVGESPDQAIEVLESLRGTGAEIRLLNTLGLNDSLINIAKILDYYNAELQAEMRIKGSSQVKSTYKSEIGDIVTKSIYQHREAVICKDCKEHCTEGIYGIRLIPTEKELLARLCVHRTSETTLMPLAVFSQSPQLHALLKSGGMVEEVNSCLGDSS